MIPASPGSPQAVREWLAASVAGGEPLADYVRYAPVISTESFAVGQSELDDYWSSGAWVCWWGGPAPAGVGQWPIGGDGTPLLHILTVHLSALDGALDAPSKALWGEAIQEVLPRQGTLSVFHDGASRGLDVADQEAWAVHYSESDSRELLQAPSTQPPEVICALAHAGFTVPASSDPPKALASDEVWQHLDQAWRGPRDGVADRRMSHVYGHSRFGYAPIHSALRDVLPLGQGNRHRLIASFTPPFPDWLGPDTTLEIWMRDDDLNAGRFDAAWCLLRTEETPQAPTGSSAQARS